MDQGTPNMKSYQIRAARVLTMAQVHRKHLLPETLLAYNLPWDWDEVSILENVDNVLSLMLTVYLFYVARQQLHHHQALDHRRLPRRALRSHPPYPRGQAGRPDLQLHHRTQDQRPQQGQDVPGAEEEPEPTASYLRIKRFASPSPRPYPPTTICWIRWTCHILL